MTSSIYGITVTVLVMYIFLGRSVTLCGMRKNFAHVFGKRNDGFLSENTGDDIFDKHDSVPLLDKLRLYRELTATRKADDLSKDSFYGQKDEVRRTVPPVLLETYGNDQRKDSLSILDIMSPVEKEYLSYLYDMEADDRRSGRFPKYI